MKILLGLALACLLSTAAFGHGGGLDSNGCHRQTSNNTFHCHGTTTPQSDGSNSSSSSGGADVGLVLGILAGGALIWWLMEDSKQQSTFSLSPKLHVTDDDRSGLSLSNYGMELKFHF